MSLTTEDKLFISEMFDQKFEQKFEEKFEAKFEQKFEEKRNIILDRLDKKMDERFEHYLRVIREDFDHKLSTLIEIGKDKVLRGEVSSMIEGEVPFSVRRELTRLKHA